MPKTADELAMRMSTKDTTTIARTNVLGWDAESRLDFVIEQIAYGWIDDWRSFAYWITDNAESEELSPEEFINQQLELGQGD